MNFVAGTLSSLIHIVMMSMCFILILCTPVEESYLLWFDILLTVKDMILDMHSFIHTYTNRVSMGGGETADDEFLFNYDSNYRD